MMWPFGRKRSRHWPSPATPRRVLLFGTALAGKTEIIAAFSREENQAISVYTLGEPISSRIISVGHADYTVATIPGAVWNPGEWAAVIEWATDVIYVLDPQKHQAESTRFLLERFGLSLAKRSQRVLQVTKVDLTAAPSFAADCYVPAEVPGEFGLSELRAFYSSIREPQSLTQALRFLLRGA